MPRNEPLCKNGLHPKAAPGLCRECKRAKEWRYRHSPRGRATNLKHERRYNLSTKGILRTARRDLRRAEGRVSR